MKKRKLIILSSLALVVLVLLLTLPAQGGFGLLRKSPSKTTTTVQKEIPRWCISNEEAEKKAKEWEESQDKDNPTGNGKNPYNSDGYNYTWNLDGTKSKNSDSVPGQQDWIDNSSDPTNKNPLLQNQNSFPTFNNQDEEENETGGRNSNGSPTIENRNGSGTKPRGDVVKLPDGSLPDEESDVEKYVYYKCGCKQKEIYVEEVDKNFTCPAQGTSESEVYNKVNVTVRSPHLYICEASKWTCPRGYQKDWETISDLCYPHANITNNGEKYCVVYPSTALSQDTQNMCTAFLGNNWTNFYEDTKDQHPRDKCVEKETCDQYEKWVEEGVLTAELGGNPPGYYKPMCVSAGYSDWSQW